MYVEINQLSVIASYTTLSCFKGNQVVHSHLSSITLALMTKTCFVIGTLLSSWETVNPCDFSFYNFIYISELTGDTDFKSVAEKWNKLPGDEKVKIGAEAAKMRQEVPTTDAAKENLVKHIHQRIQSDVRYIMCHCLIKGQVMSLPL